MAYIWEGLAKYIKGRVSNLSTDARLLGRNQKWAPLMTSLPLWVGAMLVHCHVETIIDNNSLNCII